MTSSRYQYRVIEGKDTTLILRDDGHRIWFKILDPTPMPEAQTPEWVLWADYKQCEFPGPAEQIAAVLMGREKG